MWIASESRHLEGDYLSSVACLIQHGTVTHWMIGRQCRHRVLAGSSQEV